MNIANEQNKAAVEITELIANNFGTNRRIHPGTAISAGARLAGSFVFRSFNFNLNDIKPGTAVLSEQANEKGPILINVLGASLSNFGLNLDKDLISKSSKVDSNISFIETMNNIQSAAHDIMKQNNLNYEQMAYACAMATALIIKECKAELSIESGFNTAIYGFIEGSKTCPPLLNTNTSVKKRFLKFWK